MKKLLIGLTFVLMFSTFSCNMGADTREVLKQADTLYLVVRTVVTDPGVLPLLSRDTLEKLMTLEARYLDAKKLYLSGIDKEGLRTKILAYTGSLIGIFEKLPVLDKYSSQMATARVAVKILRIQLE
ncbi:MAG: hypothetical protein DRH26_00730 [Deltaproteobacteria bacterium]|nr:MAG: hypothetical protein DRH26_00730 [Deltaproteobacteria bacterium]